MNRYFVICSMACLLLFDVQPVAAQEVISSSGGSFSNAQGSFSFTAGLVAFTEIRGSGGSAVQGIQQVFEISDITGIPPKESIAVKCSVYPNPTSDYLEIMFEGDRPEDVRWSLLDNKGKLLDKNKINGSLSRLSVSNLPAAAYFLTLDRSGQIIRTFKIIKK